MCVCVGACVCVFVCLFVCLGGGEKEDILKSLSYINCKVHYCKVEVSWYIGVFTRLSR